MNGFTTSNIGAQNAPAWWLTLVLATACCCAAGMGCASADETFEIPTTTAVFSSYPLPTLQTISAPKQQRFNYYLQSTDTQQYHGAFRAEYSGPQSIAPQADTAKTVDATLFAGARIGSDTAVYVNAEFDQGFGLGTPPDDKGDDYSGTYGAAGFPSAESYKVGSDHMYSRVQRAFVRQTLNFGGDRRAIDPDANQLGGSAASQNLVLTVGKFGVTDVFDGNVYAHDPKNDFLNWSIVDSGAFDYPADAWGYTSGASAELNRGKSTLRAGLFQLSTAPNDVAIEHIPLRQFGSVLEFEQRTAFFGNHPGALKELVYADDGYMGSYADAMTLGEATAALPSTALVRADRHLKFGAALNVAQEVARHLGVFARLSAMNGTYEAYDFTEIDRSAAAGVSIDGGLYQRPNDTLGIACSLNGLSVPAQRYFAAGGTGLLLGDGSLSYGGEQVLEAFYRVGFSKSIGFTFDYQHLTNPGYNLVRGPISIFGLRYHVQI